jgi:hypothetical protein
MAEKGGWYQSDTIPYGTPSSPPAWTSIEKPWRHHRQTVLSFHLSPFTFHLHLYCLSIHPLAPCAHLCTFFWCGTSTLLDSFEGSTTEYSRGLASVNTPRYFSTVVSEEYLFLSRLTMSSETPETTGSLADRITKPDVTPDTQPGTSLRSTFPSIFPPSPAYYTPLLAMNQSDK